jgi:prophage regulatory protein
MSQSNSTQQTVNYVNPAKMLRIKDVMKKLGIARATIYDWLNTKSPRYDPTFPPASSGALNQLAGWSQNWTTG